MSERDRLGVPVVPEPMWIGFRLRIAECRCGARFRGCTAREKYRAHWRGAHELDAYGSGCPVYRRIEGTALDGLPERVLAEGDAADRERFSGVGMARFMCDNCDRGFASPAGRSIHQAKAHRRIEGSGT